MDDRQKFDAYVEKINAMLRSDEFYQTFKRRLRASKPQLKLAKKSRSKQFETDWIDMIESCITSLDNIVRNPRKFIVIEEDIVDISLARAISTESVKHLAQHTNMIASVDKEGNVTPNKILNTTKEESFEIYENRFIYTLLKNLSNFVARRMDAIKKAYVNDNILELDVDANFYMGKTRVFYNLELIGSVPSDVEEEIQGADLKIVERVTKLQRIISDFLSSPFAKQMINSAPVRPPITRTNVILKNPDFKKALVLWQFIESYSKMGFSVENVSEKMNVDEGVETAVGDMMFICNSLMEGLVNAKVEDALFFDEANMTETETAEGEAEGEKEKEVEKEVPEEAPAPETVETPSPEEEEGEKGEEQPAEEKEKEDEGEEELPDEFGVAEIRNMFQQTDGKVDKAQLARINKAIDRVLLNESTLRAQKKSQVAEIRYRQQEIEKEKLLKEMEKEKLALERSLAKKEKIAAKERESLEKQRERDKKRLEKLEREMREKQEEVAASVEEESEKEDLGQVEDLSVTPMLEALKSASDDAEEEMANAPQETEQAQETPTENAVGEENAPGQAQVTPAENVVAEENSPEADDVREGEETRSEDAPDVKDGELVTVPDESLENEERSDSAPDAETCAQNAVSDEEVVENGQASAPDGTADGEGSQETENVTGDSVGTEETVAEKEDGRK